MRHRLNFNKLGLKASHRRAMIRNMVVSLFKYERIRTTKARAIEVKRKAEKLITRAKKDSVHNRRLIWRDVREKAILAKLFTVIAPRFLERKGGYARILKLGKRTGDAAELVLLELVERTEISVSDDKKAKKKESKRSENKETEKKEAISASSS